MNISLGDKIYKKNLDFFGKKYSLIINLIASLNGWNKPIKKFLLGPLR